MSLDEIKNNLGSAVFNEELAEFVGYGFKSNVDCIQVRDLLNYLVSEQDFLVDYANKYLMYGAFKEAFRKHLESKYKLLLKD